MSFKNFIYCQHDQAIRPRVDLFLLLKPKIFFRGTLVNWNNHDNRLDNNNQTYLKTDLFHVISTLDKLLGQLGFTQPGNPQLRTCKDIVYFHIFLRFVFFYDYTFSYCMKPSGMCLHTHRLPF